MDILLFKLFEIFLKLLKVRMAELFFKFPILQLKPNYNPGTTFEIKEQNLKKFFYLSH